MRNTISLAAVFVAFIASAHTAHAQLAFTFADAQTSLVTGDASLGFGFTTTSAVTVDGLAYYLPVPDVPRQLSVGGVVRLYDSNGTTLAAANVLTTDPTANIAGFIYNVQNITPVALSANATYFVVADVFANRPDLLFDTVGLTSPGSVQFAHPVAQLSGFGNPLVDEGGTGGNSFLTPNFRLVGAAAPEPGALSLLLLAAGGAGILRRRVARRRSNVTQSGIGRQRDTDSHTDIKTG